MSTIILYRVKANAYTTIKMMSVVAAVIVFAVSSAYWWSRVHMEGGLVAQQMPESSLHMWQGRRMAAVTRDEDPNATDCTFEWTAVLFICTVKKKKRGKSAPAYVGILCAPRRCVKWCHSAIRES